MLKLYRTIGGVTEYWEAWITATDVTIHWGRLGEEGESRELPHETGLHPSKIIEREAKPIRVSGFKPIRAKDLHSIVVQYKIAGHGTRRDHDRRVQVEDRINESLGWSGLGHCDGGDIGSGTMNVFCRVVDAGIAGKIIVKDLSEHGLLEGAVIAQVIGDKAKVLWPPDFVGVFAVL